MLVGPLWIRAVMVAAWWVSIDHGTLGKQDEGCLWDPHGSGWSREQDEGVCGTSMGQGGHGSRMRAVCGVQMGQGSWWW